MGQVCLLGPCWPPAPQVLQKEESCSFTLALLIVRRNLVAELALAPVLPALVNACQEAEDGQQLLEKVIEQLREAGYHPVAASVQVEFFVVVHEWFLFF